MSFATEPEVTPTTPRRRTARREATRLRILSAAEDVFAERGFHGASVEDICERAEFTRGAFYSNFASKDELVLELFQQHVTRLQAAIAEVAARPELPLAEVFEAVFEVWTGEPEARRRWYLLTGEFALHALRDQDVRQAWIAVQGEVRRELAALVDQIAVAHGMAATIPTEDFVRIVTAVFQGGLGQHLLDPQAVPAGSLEREFLPLLVAAVSTQTNGQPPPR